MIPKMSIIAWGNVVPWADQFQVEQDLIISRIIVELFNDPFLKTHLRFRGGTALNKLHFTTPIRYSEDIDLVRTTLGPIKPIIDSIRNLVDPWLGSASYVRSPVAPKLRYRTIPEDANIITQMRIKIEINTFEIEAFDELQSIPFEVSTPWFSGKTNVATYSREEMLATKLRAFLQRDKGRDLLDLVHGLDSFSVLDETKIIKCFLWYLEKGGVRISRAEAEQRMLAKFRNPSFMTDIYPLLAASEARKLTLEGTKTAFTKVFRQLITKIPGAPWAKSKIVATQMGLSL